MRTSTISKWTITWIFAMLAWMLAVVAYGQNWRPATTINASVDFYGVDFTSDQVGYAVGTAGSIYKTIDGGLTWSVLTSNTAETLYEIFFVNNSTGYAVGANGTIRKTIDAGVTWTTVTVSGTSTTIFYDVHFINANNGYIAGSGGKMIKTTNGGGAWTTLTTGTSADIKGIHFTMISTGYFVASSGLIRKTADGGSNWSTQATTPTTTEDLNDVYFLDDNTGYVCGTGGAIYKTVDAGLNWLPKVSGLGSLELYSIQFANASDGNTSSLGGWHWVTTNAADNWIAYNTMASGLFDTEYASVNTGYMVGQLGIVLKYQSELEPEIQPGDMTFSEVYSTTLRVNYSASPDLPTGYIAVRKTGSAPTTNPMDGITYTQGQALGDGTVVYIGSSTSFNQSGLTPGTTYYYNIYAYNGGGAAINYKHSSPLSGSKATYSAGSPWNLMYAPGGLFSPEEIHYYDANIGGTAGGYSLEVTTNGGQNWTSGFPANGDGYYGLFFVSPTTGYTVGSNSNIRVIRRTVNGGVTWVDQVRTTSSWGFKDVWFPSTLTGVAVGGEGQIHRTTNGVTWSATSTPTSNQLNGVHFPTATIGFAVGDGGTIIKSTTGGSTWSLAPGSGIVTTNSLNDVFFADANTGYAVGVGGTILKTMDGGVSWVTLMSGTTNELRAVHFSDASTGHVVGFGGVLLKTTNGGADWYPFMDGISGTPDFYGVFFPTPHTGYVGAWDVSTGKLYQFQSVPSPTSQPTSLNFSSFSSSGFTVAYNAPAAAVDGYLVVRGSGVVPTGTPLDGAGYSVGAPLGNGVVAYSGSATSFSETTLAPGTEYYYKVYAYNSSGSSGSLNYVLDSPLSGATFTLLSPPTASSASSITTTGFTANWSSVSGASEYRLDVSLDGFTTFVAGYNNLLVSGTSRNVTGLQSGTTYSYRVRAINSSGASANSNVINVLTLPAAPAVSAATLISIVGLTANWSASVGATGYQFDLSTSSGFSTYVGSYHDFPLTATQLTVTGLAAGTTYYYRLRALNATGISAYSSTISTPLICDPPGATSASSVTGVGFTANWSPSVGAADYRFDLATDPSFNFFVGSFSNFTVTGTSRVVNGLSTGTTYYYRLRAANSSGSSANSAVISVLTWPSAPVNNDATSIGSSTFVANWTSVPTATGYKLDVSTSAAFSSFISGYNDLSVPGTSATVTVPTEGITYYCRVRAVNASGTSNASSNTITTLLKPATPVASSATSVSGTGFTANWAAASGASGYTLEVSSDNFVTNEPGYDNVSVGGTSTSVTDLLEGVSYKYRVRAVNAQWSSSASNTITVGTIPPPPTALSPMTVTTTGFSARWAITPGATSYRLDVSLDNFSTLLAGYNNLSVSGTSSSVTGLSAGVTYQYRVRAVNTSGTSSNSNAISTSTLSVAPIATTSTGITSSGFTAGWNAVTGASDYRVDVSNGSGFSTFEGIYNNLAVSSTAINITGLAAGGTYYFRVRANNSSGASANSNTTTSLLKPAAPNATIASGVSTTGLTANWSAISGATGYKLDVSANDFISNLTGYDDLSVAGTSQAVVGLTAGATYKYRVRALNATGASDNSNSIAAITVPAAPVATAATQVTATAFTATWNTVSSVPAYYLDVAVDNTFTSFLPGYNNFPSSTGSQTVSGLTEGVTYYYRVRGANSSGTSSNSSTIQAATLPLAPVADPASFITASGFTASWSTVTGATDYRIDISTDIGFSFYVGSYFNQQVAGTLLPVAGLSPGTVYYYRVRAVNSSGSSLNSQVISALTLPGAPVAFDALSVTGTTFLANWGSVSTATSYRLDVSTASNFSTFVTGYDALVVSATSTVVTLPVEGTTYYYRVRAVSSAGTSAYSNTIATLLRPAAPIISAATSITAEGFTAGWLASPGATGYYVDISANNFASFIVPYENFLLAGTSLAISGLTAGTSYQYRVRSYNAAGASSSSAIMTTVTIPPAPVTVQSTSFTTTSFTANWQVAAGATEYKLDVSTDFAFGAGSFVPGYQDLTVTGNFINITDLQAGTVYYYRVRAVNMSGTSPNSNVTSSTNVPPPPTGLLAGSITTTGLSISWTAAPGALTYALDVSSNHFASFTNAYNNLSVTGTTLNLVGLAAGTGYQIRVRAVNASGTSLNSAVLNAQTLPDEPLQPTAVLFTEITTTSLKIEYTGPAGGAAGYIVLRKLDSAPTGVPADALTYNLGTTLGDAMVAYVGSATTFNDGGLEPGEKYFYTIFAYNGAGVNTNYRTTSPLVASQITVPSAPALSAASAVGQVVFRANWTLVKGAEDYLLDVSVDNFTTFVGTYQDQLTGNVSSFDVTGLTGGTSYQYRLRAKNAAGVSGTSAVQSVLTIPATPTNLVASTITSTSFEVNWNAAPGATGYHVDLSTDENFSILTVNGGTTPEPKVTFSGLGNSTKYFARARSVNASGSSPSSVVLSATTLAGGSGPAALTVGTASFTPTIKGSPVAVSVSVTGGADPKTVTLRHRKITATAFSDLAVALKSGSVYEVNILPDMTDELGVEFYFTASDVNGTTDESDVHHFIHQAIDAASNKSVPFTLESFNGKAATYQMFSIPYELVDNNIANLFEPALNGFSNTRWRLLRYDGGNYIEYPDQLKKIELGQGYWFNTIQSDFEIKLSAATADLATPQAPFEIVLEKGWNQIGDPYPFNVDWSAVQNANSAAGLSSFWHFEEGGFVKKTVLQSWKAGFVFSENGGPVAFPLSSRTTSAGRVEREPGLDPSEGEWQMHMVIQAGDIRSGFAVGMRTDAKSGKDQYDEIAIPRFLDFLEVSSFHPEFFAPHFATDVVPVASTHSWEFSVNTNLRNSPALISWDKESLAGLESSAFLFDPANQMLVNMKVADKYAFVPKDGQKLKVMIMPERGLEFETVGLGVGYPNPFVSSLRIPLFVETPNSRVNVQVFTAMGQPVRSIDAQYIDPGYHELEWQTNPADANVPSEGLLLYRITVNGVPSQLQRVVKSNQ